MDEPWTNLPRNHPKYENGLEVFLKYVFEKSKRKGLICCLCKDCRIGMHVIKEVVNENCKTIHSKL